MFSSSSWWCDNRGCLWSNPTVWIQPWLSHYRRILESLLRLISAVVLRCPQKPEDVLLISCDWCLQGRKVELWSFRLLFWTTAISVWWCVSDFCVCCYKLNYLEFIQLHEVVRLIYHSIISYRHWEEGIESEFLLAFWMVFVRE